MVISAFRLTVGWVWWDFSDSVSAVLSSSENMTSRLSIVALNGSFALVFTLLAFLAYLARKSFIND